MLRPITLISAPLLLKASEICLQEPGVEGDCRAQIGRWTFDSKTNTCVYFDYGGCGGNENNFEEVQDCLAECADEETGCNLDKYLYALFGFNWETSSDAKEYEKKFQQFFEQVKEEALSGALAGKDDGDNENDDDNYDDDLVDYDNYFDETDQSPEPEIPERPIDHAVCNSKALLKSPTPKKSVLKKIVKNKIRSKSSKNSFDDDLPVDRYYYDSKTNACVHFLCPSCHESDDLTFVNQFFDFRHCLDRCGNENTKSKFTEFEGDLDEIEWEFNDHKKFIVNSWKQALFWDGNGNYVQPLSEGGKRQSEKRRNPSISDFDKWAKKN